MIYCMYTNVKASLGLFSLFLGLFFFYTFGVHGLLFPEPGALTSEAIRKKKKTFVFFFFFFF